MTPRSHWTSAVDKGRKDQLPLGLYRLTNMSCQHISSPFPMIYVKFNEPACQAQITITSEQWWNVTKYKYFVTLLK